MKLTDKPAQISVPFASSGDKDAIPVNATQETKEKGKAAWDSGFPPLTMTAIAAGGIPPSGKDFNGVLNAISAGVRFAMAGGLYPYNADFSTAIGGYPLGAILISADGGKVWWNVSDANTTDPDSSSASGWKNLLQDPDDLFLKKAQNLADLQNKGTARQNLDLDKVGNFMAVQQGGGEGMLANKAYLGWNGAKILAQIDTTPMGALFYEKNPPTAAQTGAYPVTGGYLNEGSELALISISQNPSTGDYIYSPALRTTLKGRGAYDVADGASAWFQVVEHVGTLGYAQIVWNGFGSTHSFIFDQNGRFYADSINSGGEVNASGDVTAGGARYQTDGNLYGSAWGGYLSEWLNTQLTAMNNDRNNCVRSVARGGQQFFQGTYNGTGSNWEAGSGCVMTGFNSQVSDGRGMHAYFRALYVYTNAGGWMQIGDIA